MLNHDAHPDDSANVTQSIQIPGTSRHQLGRTRECTTFLAEDLP